MRKPASKKRGFKGREKNKGVCFWNEREKGGLKRDQDFASEMGKLENTGKK